MFDLIIIGGGAAGIFAAITAKNVHPNASVLVLEKTGSLLSKVRISGGGRCNATNYCFDPRLLVKNYPRGARELLGPFHHFGPQETVDWFAAHGVTLKAEPDGRMFPSTDSSETIIHCLLSEAKELGMEIRTNQHIDAVTQESAHFQLELESGTLQTKHLLITTGSHPQGHRWAQSLGHTIQSPVPSLFTFNIPNSPLKTLSGISLEDVELTLTGTKHTQRGPLLITHFGLSGPAVLILSARAARTLAEKNYNAELSINWLPQFSEEERFQTLSQIKSDSPHKNLASASPFSLPKNLWKILSERHDKRLSHIPLKELRQLATKLHSNIYLVKGMTTHKEEFVTCGGVTLNEINFRTLESKICPGLYFAGEILDIDGITGGFNFQNAWTTGHIAGTSALRRFTPSIH